MSSKPVNELFKQAQSEGLLSTAAMNAINVIDPGAQIQTALGVNVDDVQASEVVLLGLLLDDSGSIEAANNTQLVCDGHNLVLDSLSASKQKDNILAHARYLNGHIHYPFCALDAAIKMDTRNFNPVGGTPLYDQYVAMLATMLAKAQQFAQNGVPCRTVTLVVTDGHDEHSTKANIGACGVVTHDMKMAETHIIAAMGIDDKQTNFRAIFREMGIDDKWILTPGNTPSEIRKAFQVFSQSAVRASQSAASFSKTALGGFTA